MDKKKKILIGIILLMVVVLGGVLLSQKEKTSNQSISSRPAVGGAENLPKMKETNIERNERFLREYNEKNGIEMTEEEIQEWVEKNKYRTLN